MSDVRAFEMSRVDRVLQGAGSLHAIAAELDRRRYGKALLITGRSVGASPPFQGLVKELGSRVAAVVREVRAHNPVDGVMELVARARDVRADVIVAVGGGSPIDAAKLASLGVGAGVTTLDELTSYRIVFEYPSTIHIKAFEATPLPIFAVPTTLSAAEWDGFAGSVDHARDTKDITGYLTLTPEVVVLDPEICVHTPRDLWTTTGVRALDHAIETMYANTSHPFTTALAEGALALLAKHLPRSARDAADLEAALQCQLAAWMSIVGVHNVSLGLSHAIGHQLGALGIPHGVTSCIMLPHVMRFLEPNTSAQQKRMAEILHGAGWTSADGSAADGMDHLLNALGVPRKVSEFGIARDKMAVVARATLGDVIVAQAPRRVDERAVMDLLEAAW